MAAIFAQHLHSLFSSDNTAVVANIVLTSLANDRLQIINDRRKRIALKVKLVSVCKSILPLQGPQSAPHM